MALLKRGARVIIVTLTGHSPLKLSDNRLRDTVVNDFSNKYSSYNSEMGGAPTLKDVRHRAGLLGEFVSDSQRR